MKNGRKYAAPPALGDLEKFAEKWRGWWASMQPAWRKLGDLSWPLVRRSHEDEEWPELMRGGKNGFVVVLISLAWWKAAAKTDSQVLKAASAIEDVEWVLREMWGESECGEPEGEPQVGGKRRASERVEGDEGAKR